VRSLDDCERIALLNAGDQSDWRDLGLLVRLALSTGARQGELLNPRWRDIDLKAGIAYEGETQNDEPRVLPLMEPVGKLLAARARPIKGWLLFPAQRDTEQPYNGFRRYWELALTEAKITNLCFHDLRHPCASYLAMNGASPIEIGDVLEHKTLAIVRRYSHLSVAHKPKLTERVLGALVQ
jgi:integrase